MRRRNSSMSTFNQQQITEFVRRGFESGDFDRVTNLQLVDGHPFFLIWYRDSTSGEFYFRRGTARWDGSTLSIEGPLASGDAEFVPAAFHRNVAPVPEDFAVSEGAGGFFIMAANPQPFEESDEKDRAARYRQLRAALVSVLDLFDPEHIAGHRNPGAEYEPEVDRLLPHLHGSTTAPEIRDMLLRIFEQMFSESSSLITADADAIASIALGLWTKYHEQLEAIGP